MTSFKEAYTWFNHGMVTHLGSTSQPSMNIISSSKMSDPVNESEMIDLINRTRGSDDRLEYPEVMVYCAKVLNDWNCPERALEYLGEADSLYEAEHEDHRQGVVLWMMGILEWKNCRNDKAIAHCQQARELFEKLHTCYRVRTYHDSHIPTVDYIRKENQDWADWYFKKIRTMDLELTATPEEGFSWINAFNYSHLSANSRLYTGAVLKGIEAGEFTRVNSLLTNLLENAHTSQDGMETAEIQAFCGLIKKQMGYTHDSTRLLHSASVQYLPGSHPKAATRWILGMSLFSIPGSSNQAAQQGKTSIEEMEALEMKANHDNLQNRRKWYERRIELMKVVLQNRIAKSLEG